MYDYGRLHRSMYISKIFQGSNDNSLGRFSLLSLWRKTLKPARTSWGACAQNSNSLVSRPPFHVHSIRSESSIRWEIVFPYYLKHILVEKQIFPSVSEPLGSIYCCGFSSGKGSFFHLICRTIRLFPNLRYPKRQIRRALLSGFAWAAMKVHF